MRAHVKGGSLALAVVGALTGCVAPPPKASSAPAPAVQAKTRHPPSDIQRIDTAVGAIAREYYQPVEAATLQRTCRDAAMAKCIEAVMRSLLLRSSYLDKVAFKELQRGPAPAAGISLEMLDAVETNQR
jgi:hypothetical protein